MDQAWRLQFFLDDYFSRSRLSVVQWKLCFLVVLEWCMFLYFFPYCRCLLDFLWLLVGLLVLNIVLLFLNDVV